MRLSQLFSHWDQIHKVTLAVIDQFSLEELTFIPFPGGWSVGQIILHIADAEDGWFRTIVQKKYDSWPTGHTLADCPTKEDIKTLLVNVHNRTMEYLSALYLQDLDKVFESDWGRFSLRFIIWHVLEHEIHHRGELSLILGILGKGGLGV